jgi:predicted nucleotidyltransferase
MQTISARGSTLTFEEVISKLANHRAVEGIVVFGSASAERITSASDHDLVIVLADESAPIGFGTTYVSDRLTDLLFFTVAEIEQVISLNEPVDADERLGQLIRWLKEGQVVLDRSGWLGCAQRKVREGLWLLPAGASRRYQIWYKINFDLRHAERMVISNDPVYQRALEMRLLFSIFDVFLGYFLMRGMIWEGSKAAIRYLLTNDPEYLTLLEQCLAETNLLCKVEMYKQLAKLATEPAGGLWTERETAVQTRPDVEWDPGLIGECLEFWQHLLSG